MDAGSESRSCAALATRHVEGPATCDATVRLVRHLYTAARAVPLLVMDSDRGRASELAELLERSGFKVLVRNALHDATTEGEASLDVVVLGPSGGVTERVSRCRRLREEGYVGAILAACTDVAEGDLLLDAGADDFVTLPWNELELAARVRSCERRTAARPRLRWGPLELDRVRRTLHLRGRFIALTPRDSELLACLIEAGGRAVSRSRLRERVWQGKEDRGTNVVEVHLSRLRDKLGDDAWVIETVRRAGYRLRRLPHGSR